MAKDNGNVNLHSSRNAKADEFYTQISFIENELIRDSFGVRWLKCDHCGEIKQDGEFNILGITRDTPGRGVCTLCARKMT